MYKEFKILAFIPARKGSKGIPNKNIINLAGKPLIQHTFDLVKSIDLFDGCFVSTDSDTIMNLSKGYGFFNHDLRPSNLAQDRSILYDVIKYEISKYNLANQYDVIVLLQPTSPLRKSFTVAEGIKSFLNSNFRSAIGVTNASDSPIFMRYIEKGQLKKIINLDSTIRRQDLPKFYTINGAIYINFLNDIMCDYVSFNDNEFPIIFSSDESTDIDELNDLKLAEEIINKE